MSFLRPADSEAVLAAVTQEQFSRDELLPYWAELWPAAEAMAQWLLANAPAAGLSVCEVGCGLGVVATVLALRGATLAAAVEISPEGCRYARANLLAHGCSAPVVCADFRCPPFRERFDVLVASDILYEERWLSPITRLLAGHLSPDGFALIADPCRSHWPRFLAGLACNGLRFDIVHRAEVNQGKTLVEIARVERLSGAAAPPVPACPAPAAPPA